MSKTLNKQRSILLTAGLDISRPGEYLDPIASPDNQNFRLDRSILTKRKGITQLGSSLSTGNILTNQRMETWSDGASSAPDNWTLVGAGAAIARESTIIYNGTYSAKITSAEDIDSYLYQEFYSSTGITYWQNKTVTFGAWVWCDTANIAKVQIYDDVNGATNSIYHTGSSDWEWLTVTATISFTATLAWAVCSLGVNDSTIAYFDSVNASLENYTEEIMAGRELIREGTRYNVRIGINNIERWDNGSNSWVDITGNTLTGTTNDLMDTAVPLLSGKAILCITNGIDAIQKYDASGDTAVLGGTPPVAKFIQEYKTYLVCANIQGGIDVAQRVQWCDTADPETWDSGNAGSVDLVEDGEDITGMGLFNDYVAIHKKSAIYLGALVSSNDIFRFDRRSVEKGTIANATIVNIPTGEQIYLAEDGIRLFNGVSAPLVDAPINAEIRDELNQEYAFKSWGCLVSEQDEVWIGLPMGSQTTGDTVYKYNYNTGKLYKDTRSNITCAWRALQTSDITWDDISINWDDYNGRWNDSYLNTAFALIHLSDNLGFTYKVDNISLDDDETPINASWISKDFISDDVGQLCRWQELHLWARGSSIEIEYSTDGGGTWTVISGSPFTLDSEFPSDSSPDIFYLDVISSKIRFRFTNSNSGESLAIKQFVVGYKPREFAGV
jgi:hypothetical protein